MRLLHPEARPVPGMRWLAGTLALGVAAPAMAALPTTSVAEGAATQGDLLALIAYVVLALVFSFLCSVAEAVLLSLTPSYIARVKTDHPRRAALMQRLKQEQVDRSLAAILTLNTIAHTVGAIGSGAKAALVFGSAWVGLFSALVTLLILFLSEIVPKTLGALHWRALAPVTMQFIRGLIWLLYPLIRVAELLTRLLSRGRDPHAFDREELIAMAGVGAETGVIDPRESRVLGNLFRLEQLTAADVMTPRTVLTAFDENSRVEAVIAAGEPRFSRLPVYTGDIDHVTGFVLKDELLLAQARGEGARRLAEFRRPLRDVPQTQPLSELLEQLLAQRQHLVRVCGPYGGTQGLVSLEDVVETLLGREIVDETDAVADLQRLARQRQAERVRALESERDAGAGGGGSA